MTFGSLFAGIGGMDLGLEQAGLECVWQVEIDKYARRVLEKNWPDIRRWDDVRTFPPEGAWGCDLICGGDPCEGNSKARGSQADRTEDLGRHFIRVVEGLRPRLVLRENPYPPRVDAAWHWVRFRRELERLGYVVLSFRLRACCFGLEHQRDRVWLLAELPDSLRQGLERQDSKIIEYRHAPRPDRRRPSPRICRRRDGLPHRMDRIRCLGKAVVPQVAEWIGRRIMEATS